MLFVNTLTRWRVSLSAERPCYCFRISRKTELILDRLGYITTYRRTLSVLSLKMSGIETYGSMVFSSMKQILNDVHDTDVSVVTLLRKQISYSLICFVHEIV